MNISGKIASGDPNLALVVKIQAKDVHREFDKIVS
jgi:hypothetical protein